MTQPPPRTHAADQTARQERKGPAGRGDDRTIRPEDLADLCVPRRDRDRLALFQAAVDRRGNVCRILHRSELAMPSFPANGILCAGHRQGVAEERKAKALKQCSPEASVRPRENPASGCREGRQRQRSPTASRQSSPAAPASLAASPASQAAARGRRVIPRGLAPGIIPRDAAQIAKKV
jgi:hypothetical protein